LKTPERVHETKETAVNITTGVQKNQGTWGKKTLKQEVREIETNDSSLLKGLGAKVKSSGMRGKI